MFDPASFVPAVNWKVWNRSFWPGSGLGADAGQLPDDVVSGELLAGRSRHAPFEFLRRQGLHMLASPRLCRRLSLKGRNSERDDDEQTHQL